MERPNIIFIIFGATGDLTSRKLAPALYNIYKKGLMKREFVILGTGRKENSDLGLREKLSTKYTENTEDSYDKEFLERVFYLQVDPYKSSDYIGLKTKIEELSTRFNVDENFLFYYSTPPSAYEIIANNLANHGFNHSKNSRMIVEKPFGTDLESAVDLNNKLLANWDEKQIYRIDHFLGKETVQNILVKRFSNIIFEPLWNHNYIDYVQITASEQLGVGSRGEYYDKSGAMRDMLQNHLLQVMGIIAMEPPVSIRDEHIRNETLKVFQSVRKMDKDYIRKNLIRGQYKGYKEEEGIDKDSTTETYAALKLFIDNWRWNGVPFYLRTGKMMKERFTEVIIQFKHAPHRIFKENECSNQLRIRIQPDESIKFRFGIKVPGSGFKVQNQTMDFLYSKAPGKTLPDAYERLLLDCIKNDATLFARNDAVEQTWKILDPAFKELHLEPDLNLFDYDLGSNGPKEARKLVVDHNKRWDNPCDSDIIKF